MSGPQDFDDSLSKLADNLPEGSGEYEFWKGPDLLEEVRQGRFHLAQILGPREIEEFRALLTGLIGLFIQRHVGDERPGWQLNGVHKLIFPQKFEVPWTFIESLSRRYESGHLLRGWALRRLMYELADLVELSQPELADVTVSVVSVSPKVDSGHRLFPLVHKYCKPKTTLQSLAVRVYLELIQEENAEGVIDERSLRRDLTRLKAWEDRDPVHTRLKKEYATAGAGHHWKARIPIRLYSESFRPSTPAELAESAALDSLREGDDFPE